MWPGSIVKERLIGGPLVLSVRVCPVAFRFLTDEPNLQLICLSAKAVGQLADWHSAVPGDHEIEPRARYLYCEQMS